MRILIIDNTIEKHSLGSVELRTSLLMEDVETQVRRGPEGDFPRDLSRFDALVLSGSKESCSSKSSWVLREIEIVQKWLATKKPFLGVCFGHQMLARALQGDESVGKSQDDEYGWVEFRQKGSSRLFQGLPGSFISYSSHREEVKTAPPSFSVTLESDRCKIQSMESKDLPHFGIQFHPETTLACAHASKRKLLNRRLGEKSYTPTIAQTVFSNFLRIAHE